MLIGQIAQVAYFVGDIRAAADRMAHQFNAGPFFVVDRIELAWAEHRGEPCKFVHSSAYGQWGTVMMELVQQDEEGRSPFRDLYGPGQEGIHHIATIVDSLEAACEHYQSCGFSVATRAQTRTGVEFAFIDAAAQLGHMIEIYAGSETLLNFYEFVRTAAENWDGREPVRELT